MRKLPWLWIFAYFFLATSIDVAAQEKPKPPDGKSAPQAGKVPAKAKITQPIPGYQDYEAIGKQLEEWAREAPGLTEVGTYGKSSKDQPLRYIRVTNLLDSSPKKKVLITACIHGNEPLATATTMAMLGTMLSEYGIQRDVTDLINQRDIYFVPVVSPDSYPKARVVDKVDPNRDFPHPGRPDHKSIPPLDDLQKFFMKHQFDAVMSGHCAGRVFIYPFADITEAPPHIKDFNRILSEMETRSKYKKVRVKGLRGTELDWYYRNGAFSVVCEFGTTGKIPTMQQTKTEFDKTYTAYLYYIREAPLVDVRSYKEPIKSDKSDKSEKPEKSEKSDKKSVPDKDLFLQLSPTATISDFWMRPVAFRL